jgi:hypothetical protein
MSIPYYFQQQVDEMMRQARHVALEEAAEIARDYVHYTGACRKAMQSDVMRTAWRVAGEAAADNVDRIENLKVKP